MFSRAILKAAAMNTPIKVLTVQILIGSLLPVSRDGWCGRFSGPAMASHRPVGVPASKEPDTADRLISLDLNQVDIRVFIKTVGQLTGINFLVDDRIQGTVTLISPTQIPHGEVYRVFESVLQMRGYAAIRSGSLVKIVPRTEGARSNLPVHIGRDPEALPLDDSLITQIIPLQYADVAQTSTVVSSLISAGGQVVASPETNSIIITDTASCVYRAMKIVQQLDVEGPRERIEIVHLKYASAKRISEQVTQVMQRSAGPSRLRRPQSPSQEPGGAIRILPDDRTNSVVLVAGPGDMEMAKGFIARLDVERPLEASNIHVIYLEHAEAQEIEKAVSTSLGRITGPSGTDRFEPFQITSDESTNSLIVVASPQDYQLVAEMVSKLDVVREQVLIEFQIMEVTDNVLKELGVDWATLDRAVSDSVRGFAFTNLGPRVEAASGNLQGIAVGAWKEVDGTPQIGAILKALEQSSGVNILSTPHVLTSNHHEATIIVADTVPFVSQSRVTEFDPATPTAIRTFDFKDVGIVLRVRPRVSGTGLVRMEIDATFSKLIEGATGLGRETPTTAKREAQTIISIMSGSTVVIGGLMRDDREKVEKKVPILGDLPIVGALFRSDRERLQKTNLLLFITPHVLTDHESLAGMTHRKRQEQDNREVVMSKP